MNYEVRYNDLCVLGTGVLRQKRGLVIGGMILAQLHCSTCILRPYTLAKKAFRGWTSTVRFATPIRLSRKRAGNLGTELGGKNLAMLEQTLAHGWL